LKSIEDIDVGFCWDDFFQQDRLSIFTRETETGTDWQRKFTDKLVKHILAKGVTGHSKD
jgi:hypothetical protein